MAHCVSARFFLRIQFEHKYNKCFQKYSSRGALIQSLFRSNYVILGVPLSYAIYGEQGSAIASMLIALVIPMYNVLAVIILAIHGTQSDGEKKENILMPAVYFHFSPYPL